MIIRWLLCGVLLAAFIRLVFYKRLLVKKVGHKGVCVNNLTM